MIQPIPYASVVTLPAVLPLERQPQTMLPVPVPAPVLQRVDELLSSD